MKIAILANLDVASNLALNQLIPALDAHETGIFVSSQVGNNTNAPSDLQSLKFFEQSLLNSLVFPLTDAMQQNYPSEDTSTLLSFLQLAKLTSNPLITLNHVNTQSGIDTLTHFKPDLIVCIRFGKILQQPIIDIPKLGVINLHSGLLPQYQGVMATFWSMLNGETEYGTTLHYIDSSQIDAGPIIERNAQPLDYTKSYLENTVELYPSGVKSILSAITQLSQGNNLPRQAHEGVATYFTFPTAAQLDAFKAKGLTLYDAHAMLRIYSQYVAPDNSTH